ncbi:MAG: MATE family efflux transporter [Steroidobacteraceae bacterium]
MPPAVSNTAAPDGWGSELRPMLALAWPLVVAQLAQSAMHTTDVVMLGRLGPDFLAGGSLAVSFLLLFLVSGMGVIGAVAPLVAQARGARRMKAVRPIVRQGLWAAIALAALMLPVVLNLRTIFGWLRQDPHITQFSAQFMHIAAWSLLPVFGIVVLRSLLSAFAATRVILAVTLLGVSLNAVLAYGFVFGHLGLPQLGLRGAPTATLIANVFMFMLLLVYVLRQRRFRRLHILYRFTLPDWPRFREIFRIGLPIGCTLLAESGLFTAAALMMGWLGSDEVAAHAIALQCASIAFMVPMGLGSAAAVRVGLAFGRGDHAGVGRAGWTALAAGTAFMACTCLLFLTAGPWLVSLFLDPLIDARPSMLAAGFLIVAGIFQLVDGAQVVAASVLRGLNDTAVPMVLALGGYWLVGLPTAYVLGFIAGWRGVGIWIGLAIALAVVAVVLVARFALRERWGLVHYRDCNVNEK